MPPPFNLNPKAQPQMAIEETPPKFQNMSQCEISFEFEFNTFTFLMSIESGSLILCMIYDRAFQPQETRYLLFNRYISESFYDTMLKL